MPAPTVIRLMLLHFLQFASQSGTHFLLQEAPLSNKLDHRNLSVNEIEEDLFVTGIVEKSKQMVGYAPNK